MNQMRTSMFHWQALSERMAKMNLPKIRALPEHPRIMVFGTPVLMMCLARPFPQEAGWSCQV